MKELIMDSLKSSILSSRVYVKYRPTNQTSYGYMIYGQIPKRNISKIQSLANNSHDWSLFLTGNLLPTILGLEFLTMNQLLLRMQLILSSIKKNRKIKFV